TARADQAAARARHQRRPVVEAGEEVVEALLQRRDRDVRVGPELLEPAGARQGEQLARIAAGGRGEVEGQVAETDLCRRVREVGAARLEGRDRDVRVGPGLLEPAGARQGEQLARFAAGGRGEVEGQVAETDLCRRVREVGSARDGAAYGLGTTPGRDGRVVTR